MTTSEISQIHYIGCDDSDLDLFENQYPTPEGMTYNSYLITDDKIAVMDTVDTRMSADWFNKLQCALNGRTPDYLVVHHMEPDHSANIYKFMQQYPSCCIVCTVKAASFIPQFFGTDFNGRIHTVKENDTLSLGHHELTFFMAPMVHWPEVMVSYESYEKTLFSADAFGKFGTLSNETDNWADEARRYYFNICGKYGVQVQSLLKKTSPLDIKTICPLHGPVLKENLSYYVNLYQIWSSYEPESKGVFIAYATLHGNTAKAAKELADMLTSKGIDVRITDLSRADISGCIENAFRYDRMVLAASSYDAGVMPFMKDFLNHLIDKTYRRRTVALVENGTWAPSSARTMCEMLGCMKEITIVEPVVTIKSSLNETSREALKQLADVIAQ